jgi:hypothetical protein
MFAHVSVYGASSFFDDPLRWDDTIVSGTVTDLQDAEVAEDAWSTGGRPGHMVRAKWITLSGTQALRGPVDPGVLVTGIRERSDPRAELIFWERVRVGTELIATLTYAEGVASWRILTPYVLTDAGWLPFDGRRWGDPIATADVLDRIRSTGVDQAIHNASLILKGKVLTGGFLGDQPGDFEFVVRPEKVIRGTVDEDFVLRGRTNCGDRSSWQLFIDRDLVVGDSYFMMLTHSGDHYEPAGGPRSILKIQNGQVTQLDDVPLRKSVTAFEQELNSRSDE